MCTHVIIFSVVCNNTVTWATNRGIGHLRRLTGETSENRKAIDGQGLDSRGGNHRTECKRRNREQTAATIVVLLRELGVVTVFVMMGRKALVDWQHDIWAQRAIMGQLVMLISVQFRRGMTNEERRGEAVNI